MERHPDKVLDFLNRRRFPITKLQTRAGTPAPQCGTGVLARQVFALSAPPTFSKELERMANLRVPVLLLNLAFKLFNRTGINHYCDVSTFGTDYMIVVLPWIEKFVVTARSIQMYFLGDLQTLKKGHDTEHCRVVRD